MSTRFESDSSAGPLLVASAPGDATASRVVGGVAGAALLFSGLRRRATPTGKLALAVAADLVFHAASGRTSLVTRALAGSPEPTRLESSIVVERPPSTVYAFWNDCGNLAKVLKNVSSVSIITGDRTHWTATGPLGLPLTWECEPLANVPNERIAWRSLGGGSLANAGEIRFTPVDEGTATLVRLVVEFETPGGRAGSLVSSLFGLNPAQTIDGDLERLKDVVERETPQA